jgi:hypothetical protein
MTNVIYERARFNECCQQKGQSVEHFINNLYKLSENCNYPAQIRDEQLRDRIVSGILDKQLSKELQL